MRRAKWAGASDGPNYNSPDVTEAATSHMSTTVKTPPACARSGVGCHYSAKAGGNQAVANGRYGINAVPGVHDGGGNGATANGATPQCLNVTCA